MGQVFPVATAIVFDTVQATFSEGDASAGGRYLHADIPPVVAVGAGAAVFLFRVAQVRRDKPLVAIPVALTVADRAGFPTAGKPANAIHPACPPAVFVIDDYGQQVKAFLLPAGGQAALAVLLPCKACRRASRFEVGTLPGEGQRVLRGNSKSAEFPVVLKILRVHRFLR